MNYPSNFYVYQTGPRNFYGMGLYDGVTDPDRQRVMPDEFVSDITKARVFDVRIERPNINDDGYWNVVFVGEEFAVSRKVSTTPYLDYYLLNKSTLKVRRNYV